MFNQDLDKVAIRAFRDTPWGDRLGIYIRAYGFVSGVYRPKELELEQAEPEMRNDPICDIKIDEAQNLMDSLWDCGLRPSQGKGSAGAMDATQKHLEDMRKIAQKFLKVEL